MCLHMEVGRHVSVPPGYPICKTTCNPQLIFPQGSYFVLQYSFHFYTNTTHISHSIYVLWCCLQEAPEEERARLWFKVACNSSNPQLQLTAFQNSINNLNVRMIYTSLLSSSHYTQSGLGLEIFVVYTKFSHRLVV